jgi:hypothetical protein
VLLEQPVQPFRQRACLDPLELAPDRAFRSGQARRPGVTQRRAAPADRAPGGEQMIGDLKGRIRPAELLAGARDLLRAERRAVGRGGPCLGRGAVADNRPACDQGRPVGALRLGERCLDRRRIVAVDPGRPPPVGGEPAELVVGDRELARAVDRDVVVVEQHDQAFQALMAGERAGLVADALHKVPVARDHVDAVIDQIWAETRAQLALGERHADRVADPLAERPGRGLDARRVAVLRMAGGARPELPEALQLPDVHLRIAGEVEQRVEQHRAVARRQHEAVAIGPVGCCGIELQEFAEQHARHVGHAHRQARMAGIGELHGVHRERPDGVGQIAPAGLAGRAGDGVRGGGHDLARGVSLTGTAPPARRSQPRGSCRERGSSAAKINPNLCRPECAAFDGAAVSSLSAGRRPSVQQAHLAAGEVVNGGHDPDLAFLHQACDHRRGFAQ